MKYELLVDDDGCPYPHIMRFDVLGLYAGVGQHLLAKLKNGIIPTPSSKRINGSGSNTPPPSDEDNAESIMRRAEKPARFNDRVYQNTMPTEAACRSAITTATWVALDSASEVDDGGVSSPDHASSDSEEASDPSYDEGESPGSAFEEQSGSEADEHAISGVEELNDSRPPLTPSRMKAVPTRKLNNKGIIIFSVQ